MDPSSVELKWLSNIPTLFDQFDNILSFDESLKSDSKNIFHIVGEKSIQYDFEKYSAVFPEIKEENIRVVPKAGHWVHKEKPEETVELIGEFLDKIDSSKEQQININNFLERQYFKQ